TYMSRAQHMSCKILLREDIWKQLQFQNKSHLFGSTVRLEWQNRADYFRTIIKQAYQVSSFRNLIDQELGHQARDVDEWPEETICCACNLLVGERMKGGKTAFTANWFWNRLADANRDHPPRPLFQLFPQAIESERRLHRDEGTRYERSLIRPRLLIAALNE